MQRAIVIGAGIAGIATSIRLAQKGYSVDVFESNDYPGGKLTSFKNEGFRFDAGPSLFTLPHLVTELFDLCGEDAQLHFRYQKQKTVCNYFWEDGQRFSMPSEKEDVEQAIVDNFNTSKSIIKKYLENGQKKYELTNSIFIEKSLHKLSTYLSWDTLKAMFFSYKLDISKSLNKLNESTFRDKKLVQLFNRYATYNGSSPYKTPGIMSMIPHLEMGIGTFFPEGGMEQITNSLVGLAERQGVKFHYSSLVSEIEIDNGKVSGIRVGPTRIEADVVVSNMDIYSTYKRLLPKSQHPEKVLDQERSSSALIFYWGISGCHPSLDLHNILFSDSYEEEFEYIFEKKRIHQDPTIYINISSKSNPKDAPDNCENWFVMINTPSDTGQDWEEMIANARKTIKEKINRVLGVEMDNLIVCEKLLEPRLIESKTSSYQGSLYGTASNSRYTAFNRHPNFSNKIKNLYFVGGSVHPGGGIPLCLNSAKIVSNFL